MLLGFIFKPSLAPEKTLTLVQCQLKNARETTDADIVMAHCNHADRLLSSLKGKVKRTLGNTGARSDTTEQALRVAIVNAYLDMANIVADLGFPDKAQRSRLKADKWGVGSDPLFSLHNRGLMGPGAEKEVLIPVPQKSGARVPDIATVPDSIFPENTCLPPLPWTFPEPDGRLTDTPQLVSCLGLLKQGSDTLTDDVLEPAARTWLKATVQNTDEKARLEAMATDLIRAFTRDEIKDKKAVNEVLYLAPVLDVDDFRFLLGKFVDNIEQSRILDMNSLRGMAQLLLCATSPGHLVANDLIKVLELVSARLQETHEQSPDHIFELTVAVSNVLDAMADTKVEGLNREELHEPLLKFLNDRQASDDPHLKYYALYAFQALLCVPNDETPWQATVRRTTKVVKGISGLVSAVKGLDLNGFMDGLMNIQQGLEGISQVVDLAKTAYEGVTSVYEGQQDLVDSLKEGFTFNRQRAWYSALRGADTLLDGGELAKFKTLVCEAPCRRELAFQWGICQRLGNLAVNTLWGVETRQGAILFLGEIYRGDQSWGHLAPIKAYILDILMQLSKMNSALPDAGNLLKDLATDGDAAKQDIYRSVQNAEPSQHVLKAGVPETATPSLLDRVQKRTDVEADLRRLARVRIKERGGSVYVPPMAKANILASDDQRFPLIPMVDEFLIGQDKVLLLVGDSGAGKTTFNLELDLKLWKGYKQKTGRIPLLISLPSIERPEKDLIAKHLRLNEFTESQIRELKSRDFIIICDGYDEGQQTHNLYESNGFNVDGGWQAQMVVSCRSEHLGQDYRYLFQPNRKDPSDPERFQQAVLVPFTMSQVKDYIMIYVDIKRPLWEASDYEGVLDQIPSLQELVKNPFLLTLSLEVLPRLTDPGQKLAANKITRVLLYDEFVAQWLERNKKKLSTQDLSDQEKEAFESLSDDGFTQRGLAFLRDMCAAIYKEQRGTPIVDYSKARDEKTWKERFFGRKDDENRLLRKAIPLTRNGSRFGFIHRSILEYGVSRAIYEPQKRVGLKLEGVESTSGRRNSFNSAFSFELLETPENVVDEKPQGPSLDSPLAKRSFVRDPSVLQFLAERVDQEPVFKKQLLDYIHASKESKVYRTAAANAISILIRSGYRFVGQDLKGIRIPGADLSSGYFDCVNFQGADLRKVSLRGSWLRRSDLSHAQMMGAEFGEWPALRDEAMGSHLVYTHDGKTLVAATDRGNLNLYATSTWTHSHTLLAHSESLTSLILSPDGSRLATSAYDSKIVVWNMDTREKMFEKKDIETYAVTLAFSPNRDQPPRLLASSGLDKILRLWDVETREELFQMTGHEAPITYVQFSPNQGKTLISCSYDKTARLWDPTSGDCLRVLEGHTDFVNLAVFILEGEQVITGGQDGAVKVFDVSTGECLPELEGGNMESPVTTLAVSPNGMHIAAASQEGPVRIWDVLTKAAGPVLRGQGESSVSNFSFSPDSLQIATSTERTVQLWDVQSGTPGLSLMGTAHHVAYSPDGRQIAHIGAGGVSLRAIDERGSSQQRVLASHDSEVDQLAYLPMRQGMTSSQLVSMSVRAIHYWDAESGDTSVIIPRPWQDHLLKGLSTSPFGDQVASIISTTHIQLWDSVSGQAQFTLENLDEGYQVLDAVYSKDGKIIAAYTNASRIHLWDTTSGKFLRSLEGNTGAVNRIAFSPIGGNETAQHYLASTGMDSTVRIWDVATGQLLKTFEQAVNTDQIAFSKDGSRIITTDGSEPIIYVWDVAAERLIFTLKPNGRSIRKCISPCGSLLTVPSANSKRRGDLIVWDLVTGKRRWRLRGHRSDVINIWYSPDSSRLFSWGISGSRIWDLKNGRQMAILPDIGQSGIGAIAWDPNVVQEKESPIGKTEDAYGVFATGDHGGEVAVWRLVPIEGFTAPEKRTKRPKPPILIEEEQAQAAIDELGVHTSGEAMSQGDEAIDTNRASQEISVDGEELEDEDQAVPDSNEDESNEDESIENGDNNQQGQTDIESVEGEGHDDQVEEYYEDQYQEEPAYAYDSEEETEVDIIAQAWDYQSDDEDGELESPYDNTGNPYEAVLQWTTVNGQLMAAGATIEGVLGLTRANAKLLQQNGAIGTPVPPKSLNSVVRKLMLVKAASPRIDADVGAGNRGDNSTLDPVTSAGESVKSKNTLGSMIRKMQLGQGLDLKEE